MSDNPLFEHVQETLRQVFKLPIVVDWFEEQKNQIIPEPTPKEPESKHE